MVMLVEEVVAGVAVSGDGGDAVEHPAGGEVVGVVVNLVALEQQLARAARRGGR